jgi:hypothetical protein
MSKNNGIEILESNNYNNIIRLRSSNSVELYKIPHKLAAEIFYDYSFNVNKLRGNILTIIEAIIVDKEQQKAVKDIIHNAFENSLDSSREDKFIDEDIDIYRDGCKQLIIK